MLKRDLEESIEEYLGLIDDAQENGDESELEELYKQLEEFEAELDTFA